MRSRPVDWFTISCMVLMLANRQIGIDSVYGCTSPNLH